MTLSGNITKTWPGHLAPSGSNGDHRGEDPDDPDDQPSPGRNARSRQLVEPPSQPRISHDPSSHKAIPASDPPPPYSPQTASSVPGLPSEPIPAPPPSYLAKPPLDRPLTPSSEAALLSTVLRTHGWRPLFGPRPRTPSSALLRAALAGHAPLHLAAAAGDAAVARALLAMGAAVDAVDAWGRTPLLMAARYGRGEVMGLLLDRGADAGTVAEGLWERAGSEAGRVLGDFGFVAGLVELAEEARGWRSGSCADDEKAGKADEPASDAVLPRRENGLSTGAGARHDRASRNTHRKLEGAAGPSSCSPRFCLPHAQMSTIQPGLQPDPLSRLARGSGLRARKLPSSAMFSPQYAEWKATCEKLQEEHRRQKERNARAEIPER